MITKKAVNDKGESKKDPKRQVENDSNNFRIVNMLTAAKKGDCSTLMKYHLANNDEEGCILNEADYDGRTALHLAAAEGHYECVEFLVKYCKVNPFIKDRFDNTPLMDAESMLSKYPNDGCPNGRKTQDYRDIVSLLNAYAASEFCQFKPEV